MRALYSSVRFLSFASNSSLRPPSSASMSRVLRSRSEGASSASAASARAANRLSGNRGLRLAPLLVDFYAEDEDNSAAELDAGDSLTLVFDVPTDEVEAVRELVCSHMERAVELAVPLEVEAQTGQDWLEAH